MAAPDIIDSSAKTDSKPAKKKKAVKASATDNTPPTVVPESAQSNGITTNNNTDAQNESPHIRELQKSIRNITKKIANASKVDNVIAENPDKTLDELVAARKINADQKAQIMKKPALQAALAQMEEQVIQYTKIDAEFKIRSLEEKRALEKTLKEQASKELEDTIASVKAEAQETATRHLEESLLLLSQFLKLAAIRRAEEEAAELEESKALEGLLAQVYSGDASAVTAMLNLINGTNDTLKSVNGEDLSVTYASLKAASMAQVPYTDNEEILCQIEAISNTEHKTLADPNITHAGFTEINIGSANASTNGYSNSTPLQEIQQNTGFSNEGIVIQPDASWGGNVDLSQSQEWIQVPSSNQNEFEINSNPSAPFKVQSWADDQPEAPAEVTAAPLPNSSDGFQEIQRNRGGRGYRGGRGDGYRSRGNFRGEGYRGRGRGGGGHRGGRRSDD